MTEEEIRMWYATLPKDLAKHNKPSAETLAMFKNMQSEIQDIKISLAGNGKDINYMKESQDRIENKLDTFISKADNCYAGKYVEDKVTKLEEKSETRLFDYFKIAIEIIIGIGIAYIGLIKL